ncbi:MAG: 30S ribosomal protein S4 [Candidatus Nanoarchaeia archaeon]|nr:30S ribosomal protein S4 [Candidatus Nanoarchaeia archaeon]MDD5054625.1 30S ribosomal protein S4 [Candidatus Nanoarchaeia archaeon]MDD5500036.1 30S ribosomal protein S4 [Candidatus Nanoarchaeia archaeon]
MGDIKKLKKSYERPKKPWEKDRIIHEKELMKKYGYLNKKEIWHFNALLRGFRQQAREIFGSDSPQKKKEGENLLKKLFTIGLLDEKATFDDVLGLSIEDISKRRLISLVLSKGLARTPKQARQFISHKHILVNKKKVSSPNYIVLRADDNLIEFADNSVFKNPLHPLISEINAISKDASKIAQENIIKQLKKGNDESAEKKSDAPKKEDKKNDKPKKGDKK